MRLVKIVRTKLGLDIGSEGKIEYRPIDDRKDVIEALQQKLFSEALEYVNNPSADELADIYEVIFTLAALELGMPWAEILAVANDKRERKGGFIMGIGMYVSTKGRID